MPEDHSYKAAAVKEHGWLEFNGILSMQAAVISCLREFKVGLYRIFYSYSVWSE